MPSRRDLDELRDVLLRALAPDVVNALVALAERVETLERREHEHAGNGSAPELLTVEHAAMLASCTPAAMRQRLHRGHYQTTHHGSRVYVLRSSLLDGRQ